MPTTSTASNKEIITALCVKGVTQIRLRLRDGSFVNATYNGWSDDYDMAKVILPGSKHQMRRITPDMVAEAGSTGSLPDSPTAVVAERNAQAAPAVPVSEYSVADRFNFLENLTDMVINGDTNSLIVTGSGGLGKSYTVTQRLTSAGLKEDEDFVIYKGFATPKSLYRALYENRERLVIFDDCDSVLEHATSLNLLKGALDSYDNRFVSWLTERADESLPDSFEFRGRVIFISNKTIGEIDQPIVSRALFVDLTMTTDEKVERLRMLLPKLRPDVAIELRQECLELIAANARKIRDLNVRSLMKTISIRTTTHTQSWARLALYSITQG